MVAIAKSLNEKMSHGAQRCARVQYATISAHAEQLDRRRFWLTQARLILREARTWTVRFGGPLHHVALYWYLDALARADRYRTWARELGGRR